MSVMTSIAKPAAVPVGRTIFTLAGALAARIKRLARAYRNRSDAAVLAAFDDRMLADMGLTRSDVRDALTAPLWDDPTNLLRARALERRLSRHRISFGLEDTDATAPPLAPQGNWKRPATSRPARFIV
jgi:uncharacterized protein YjiS (DUF1127 family)